MLTAVILAGLAALALVGNYTFFGETDAASSGTLDWLLVVVCGIGGGASGAGFSIAVVPAVRWLRRFAQPAP